MFVILTIVAAVSAQDEQSLLGVCAVYKAAYPAGHTDADLSTPFLSVLSLPEDVMTMAADMGVAEVTTQQFWEIYQAQEEFCDDNAAIIEPVVEDFQSEGDLSPTSVKLFEVAVFEVAAILDSRSSAQGQRRRAFEPVIALCFGLIMVTIIFYAVAQISSSCRRRKLAVAAPQGARLLKDAILGGVARRELSTDYFTNYNYGELYTNSFDYSPWSVNTLDLFEVCSWGEIRSSVCNMLAGSLTHTLTSPFCGGSASISSCGFNAQYAMGYLAAQDYYLW